MKTRGHSIQQIVEQQVQKWHNNRLKTKEPETDMPVITLSREPGSGGRIIAQKMAEKFGLDLFYREIILEMAQNPQLSTTVIETLGEEELLDLDDWVTSFIYDRHLWPERYLQDLIKIIVTIGKHGRAVIVGSGANLILPSENTFRVRIVAPLDLRSKQIARQFSIPRGEAQRRAIKTESSRKAFIEKYFNVDIMDPVNYDLVINTETISLDRAVKIICTAMGKG